MQAGAGNGTSDPKTDLLLHLLAHKAHQARFEMDRNVTEFAIMKSFRWMGPHRIRAALQDLETRRLVSRQTQYVVGYNEPKVIYQLTPAGRLLSKRVIAGDGRH